MDLNSLSRLQSRQQPMGYLHLNGIKMNHRKYFYLMANQLYVQLRLDDVYPVEFPIPKEKKNRKND